MLPMWHTVTERWPTLTLQIGCRRERTHMVATRTVQQFGPHGLRQRKVIEDTIRELEELGRARLLRDGRRREIRVNPALLDWDTR